jgi:hypothetical protein
MRNSVLLVTLLAGLVGGEVRAQASSTRRLAECGTVYSGPRADDADAGRRPCPAPQSRKYAPRHRGIGFEVLDAESEVCFVTDESYRLLDEIIDEVGRRMAARPTSLGNGRTTALRPDKATLLDLSRITGEVLAARGFGLYVPTETLSDALIYRNKANEAHRHVVDCDTSSLILLTVAESLGLPGSLVEMTLSSGAGHNFVRWTALDGEVLDWDTNGRQQCTGPTKNLPYQGHAMTRDEVMGYVIRLRTALWKNRSEFQRAASDYRKSMALWPGHPLSFNNFAWMVATRQFPERAALMGEAVKAADRAIVLDRRPDYLDTAGCVYAAAGDFAGAASFEAEALAGDPENQEYRDRLDGFRAARPRDCLGAS